MKNTNKINKFISNLKEIKKLGEYEDNSAIKKIYQILNNLITTFSELELLGYYTISFDLISKIENFEEEFIFISEEDNNNELDGNLAKSINLLYNLQIKNPEYFKFRHSEKLFKHDKKKFITYTKYIRGAQNNEIELKQLKDENVFKTRIKLNKEFDELLIDDFSVDSETEKPLLKNLLYKNTSIKTNSIDEINKKIKSVFNNIVIQNKILSNDFFKSEFLGAVCSKLAKNEISSIIYIPSIIDKVGELEYSSGGFVLYLKEQKESSEKDLYSSNNKEFFSILQIVTDIFFRQKNIKILKKKFKLQILKTAIISILVDSFAHNIAAHSLQQILKWLNKRIQYSNSKFKIGSNPELNKKFNDDELRKLKKIFEDDELRKAIKEDQVKDQGEVKTKINDFNNIKKDELTVSSILWNNGCCVNDLREATNAIRKELEIKNIDNYWPLSFDVFRYQYLKYINGKATFWSGVIKDSVLGGTITNWYDILYEFCYNPYFIGTIAGSENIFKVQFRVHCDDCKNGVFKAKCGKSDFMTIDLNNMMNDESSEDGKIIEAEDTDCFQDLKDKLQKKLVFLPGGDVGKHSLYTIFENLLRNIKHCEYEINGNKQIEFNIRITDDNNFYNVEMWLGNKTEQKIKVTVDGKEKEIELSKKLQKDITKPIIDDNSKPRMGGTYQDKICASQLFTNDFANVDKKYKVNNSEISFINYNLLNKSNGGKCCLSSTIRLWKGDDFNKKPIDSDGKPDENGLILKNKNEITENLRRFKLFVARGNDSTEKQNRKQEIESLGVVRVVNEDNRFNNENKFNKYYKKWLKGWLKDYKVLIEKESTEAILSNKDYKFSNYNTKENRDHYDFNRDFHIVLLTHNDEDNNLSIKNQGVAGKIYFDIDKDGSLNGLIENIDTIAEKELIEIIGTKIAVVDNRVHNFISSVGKDDKIKKGLYLKTFSEGENNKQSKLQLAKLKRLGYLPVHFLILHLTFVDNILKDDVVKFINDNLKQNGNYIFKKLVITTGRGRSNWYSDIEKDPDLKTKVLFIPPESLTSAISYGIMIKDEFEIKYGLVKLLMN